MKTMARKVRLDHMVQIRMRTMFHIHKAPMTINPTDICNMKIPMASVHKTSMNSGLMMLNSTAITIGNKPNIHAESRPSADKTLTLPAILCRSLINSAKDLRISVKLPPVSN